MTLKRAFQVLIESAARDHAGAGVGLRTIASATQKAEVVAAIRKVYPKAYGFDPAPNDMFNLGIFESGGHP